MDPEDLDRVTTNFSYEVDDRRWEQLADILFTPAPDRVVDVSDDSPVSTD